MGHLRIVLVDDNPDDRALVRRELKKEFPRAEVIDVLSREELEAVLSEGGFDLLITDYQLHWANGLEILRQSKERYPLVPVVMFTGTGSEEVAVDAMKEGLSDYILKSEKHLKRLPAAVKAVLERAEAERRAEEMETRYRDIFQSLPLGVYRTTPDGRLVDLNPAGLEIFGFSDLEEAKKINAWDVYERWEDRELILKRLKEDGYVRNFRTLMRRHDDTVFHAEIHARMVGEDYIEGVIEDITPLVEAERERADLFDTLNTLFEHLPEGVFLLDRDGRVNLANPVASYHLLSLTGAGEGDLIGRIGGRDWREFIFSAGEERFQEVRSETDKGERVFEIGGRYIGEPEEGRGAVFLIRDVTDEKRQEERMQAQERLAAIGQLAAGIAHDFNNLLTVIIGYAEIMMRDPQFPPLYRDKIDAIYTGGTRASKLVKQILDFSRKSISQKRPLDLAEFIREFGRFMERTIPENINFEVKVPDGEYVINGDSTKIQQVLANLVVNARDALTGGGRITVELGSITIQEPLSLSRAELLPGRYAVITVSDTGTGIPEEIISYIFEPFFTTKEVGKGTGLGLSQVYGIVKQHGGEVDVSSRPGMGTRFDVYLPLMGQKPEENKKDPVKEALPEGGGEKILVVEDDETVRDLIKTLLETMGYSVKEASNGLEGLRIFESEGGFDLIITDMIMPEVGGMELIREVRKKDPSVKVVVLSGYPDIEDEEMILADGVDRVIGKPINIKPFAKAIHELIEKKD